MSEYMLRVLNLAHHSDDWPAERQHAFLKACELYIGELQRTDNLIAAQPLVRTGAIVARRGGEWAETQIDGSGEIQVGYYHVRAESLDEAIAIAKRNPELEYSPTARVEVRPLKTAESETGYDYPTGG
jgi:hypothetical protein